ncbi:MAG: 16S rRNA (cytosine(967)-C(5))-methyltransferase RsmB [Thermoanaerobaculia bacterium]|nr:16S rRNA (cytosine(967)-C(5))-methyltransferase RsmB [Thermoanaerobaculia bacterium]
MSDRSSGVPRSARDRAPSVRVVAARLVDQALAALVPVDALLARAGEPFDERDRRLLAELVYGVLRWLRRLDHAIEQAAERSTASIDPPLRAPLRVAALQLFTLDRVPAHAAVSEAVDEARRRGGRGAAGFANAVLRRLARAPRWDAWPIAAADPVARLAVEASHPELVVRRWWRQYGEERTRGIVAANNGPRAPHLLAFADRGGRGALAEALAGEGVATAPSALSPLGLVVADGQAIATRAFARGDFYLQDAASQAAALVPPPRAGERVLDAAAAPGGKGLALLAAEPAARVVFADASLARLRRLDENLRRLGRPASRVAALAQAPPWRAAFDRIVLDAPCTGTGTLRRHPELRWRFSSEALARLARDSERMLRALAVALRPGGLLILATCSIEREENETVVDRVLAAEPALQRRALIEAGVPPDDAGDREAGLWRVLPSREHDGFSVHVLARRD